MLVYEMKAIVLWLIVLYISIKLHRKGVDCGKYLFVSGVLTLFCIIILRPLVFKQVIYFTVVNFILFFFNYKGGTFRLDKVEDT